MASTKALTAKAAKDRKNSGDPDFTGFTTVTVDAAAVLAAYRGSLTFPDLSELSVEVAELLSRHRGDLHIYSISNISVAALQWLLKHEGFLCLTFPENEITLEQAKALSLFPWGLSLTPSPDYGEDWKEGLASDKVVVLQQHPSLRFDYGTVESWLLERLGFDWEAKGTAWLPTDVRETLRATADAFEYCIPEDDGRLMATGLAGTMNMIRKAGYQQIHVTSLYDDKETRLVFVGSLEAVVERIADAVACRQGAVSGDTGDS